MLAKDSYERWASIRITAIITLLLTDKCQGFHNPHTFHPPIHACKSLPKDKLISEIPESERGIGVGVDLGTTNSCISVLENGIPKIIPMEDGRRTAASIVSLSGEVGKEEEGCYRHVKRVMGTGGWTAWGNKGVVPHLTPPKGKKRKLSLEDQLAEAESDPAMLSTPDGGTISPEEISSHVLRKLFDRAEETTRKKVTRAVIGVPAYFNDAQRDATVRAAELAGVDRVRLLREPEAAALAYGIGRDQLLEEDPEQSEYVLVFDLGGGTFDVSILDVAAGLMEVKATAGNNMLGGSDFDELIADFLTGEVLAEAPEDGAKFWKERPEGVKDALLSSAEAVRIYLSSHRLAHLALPLHPDQWLSIPSPSHVILHPDHVQSTNSTHVFTELSRGAMERLCQELYQSLLRPIREVAILSQAMLPGDAHPAAVQAALDEEYDNHLHFQDFYPSPQEEEEDDDIDPDTLLQLQTITVRSLRKEQQKGRKRARDLAAKEQRFHKEKRKIKTPSKKTLRSSKIQDGIHGRPISRVVLVGGATRMPAVGRLLEAVTGIPPQKTVNPDEAVALGCAIQAGILDGDEALVSPYRVLTPMQAAVMRAMAEKKGMNVNM